MLSLRSMVEEKTQIISGGKTYELGKSDLIFIPPNTPYVRKSKKEQLFVFHFNAENFKNEIFVTRNANKQIADLFAEGYRAALSQQEGYRLKLNSVLYDILYLLSAPNYKKEVEQAIDIIKQNYCESGFRIDDIGKQIHLSASRLRKIFKDETKVSPKEYCNNLRFERALTLLKSGYLSVEETAQTVGFSDAKNFSSAFRKFYGVSPSHYKKR